MPTALIILAAGKGTRMNSDLPKVLHPLAGAPMFAHALAAGMSLAPDRIVLVTGHGAASVAQAARAIDDTIEIVEQSEQLGTGHAVMQARDALEGFKGDVVVLFGDTPFVRPETMQAMAAARADADIVVLGFQAEDPGRYGRLVMNGQTLEKIVEFKDASAEEKAINLCNSGIKMASAATMFSLLDDIGTDNASGEFYLTDIVKTGRERGFSATCVRCSEAETLGINTRSQLAEAEAIFQTNARKAALENGTTLIAPDTVYFSFDTLVGRDVTVEPNVILGPGVSIETGAHIRAFSHLEGCHVGSGATVGPYARLRPGAELANDAHIGNFVEIKNSVIGEGAKVNHLSYVGDASVGAKTNIGAGTITCNYDGVMKHRTDIGADCFIGSDTMLVAPVTVGDGAMTATGTVVTTDIPAEALAIGRAAQVNKPGLARKLFEKLKSAKASKEKET